MRQFIITFLILVFSTAGSWGQRNTPEQNEHERLQEFAASKEKKKIEELFSRESITLTEIQKAFDLKIKLRDSPYDFYTLSRNQVKDPNKWYFEYQVWRDLDFGVKQLVLGLVTTKYWVGFNFLIRNDTIIAVKVKEREFEFYDRVFETKFYSFVRQHEKFYKTKIKDYNSELGPFNFEYFGSSIGMHGTVFRGCWMMIKAYEDENRSLLRRWLKSMNPEKQAYAVQGFYYLEKYKGQKPSWGEQRLIDHIKSLDRKINANAMIRSSELLNAAYFDEAYNRLKERGYIKDGE